MGKVVILAREENRVNNVAESIIDECGGSIAGSMLWKGKVIGVEEYINLNTSMENAKSKLLVYEMKETNLRETVILNVSRDHQHPF